MEFLGINFDVKNIPELDTGFIPLQKFNDAFLKTASVPIGIAVERADGEMASVETFIHSDEKLKEADRYYIRRLIKTLLWMKGGYKVYVCNCDEMYDYLHDEVFCDGGIQDFDFHYFTGIFEKPFEVVKVESLPESKDTPKSIGGHLEGCRIGFDAGGSDRKVSAVVDGESVFSEEVVWYPKLNDDPDYHYEGIVSALKTAAEHMPRVDAVGVSTAGIVISNRIMSASLFIKVPRDLYDKKVKDIYIRAIKDSFGDIPYSIINDGDVTALAGAESLGVTNILGIAMGTSEAGGFVDENGCIKGWLNELAFIPVDASENAMMDEWSLDIGCGVKYFSQDAVIKLADLAGIVLDETASPAQKLKVVQSLAESGDKKAETVFKDIGCYLAHSLNLYHSLYGFSHVLLLGRVMSGKGGDLILSRCEEVLRDEYSELHSKITVDLPDEKFRRLGQSAAAASLPEA